ncbi:MAG: hypothetical protein EPO26_00100 [Chloroflexota bacterium]|nr:MAG: hypothetical protein EPO26_00100 [Chloroflexota bacterium]
MPGATILPRVGEAATVTHTERFVDRSARLGVSVTHTMPGDIASAVARIAAAVSARRAVVSADVGPERGCIVAALEASGVAILDGTRAAEVESMDLGVTGAAFAVAESGSIAVVGRDRLARFATMLPPVHIAILRESDIVPTLDEAGERLESALRNGARIASLVAGPSRTADVEKTLAVGVHGPREVHIILVGED